MEMNIGIFGGDLNEKKEMYKDIYNVLLNDNISAEFDINEKDKITQMSFDYEQTRINVLFENTNKFFSLDLNNKNANEIKEEISNYIKENFKVELHFIIIIYIKEGDKNLRELAQYSKGNFMGFSFGTLPFDKFKEIFTNKEKLYDSLVEEVAEKDFKEVLREFIEIYFPQFSQFQKYSVEHYYSFWEYKQKNRAFSAFRGKKFSKLLDLFNEFELFSFDNKDYSDDAVIIIQCLANRDDKEDFVILLRRSTCENCRKNETISEYDEKTHSFLCQICQKVQNGEIICKNCGEFPEDKNFILMKDCCNLNYCIKCLSTEFNKKKKKGEKPICFCNYEVKNQDILQLCGVKDE